MVFTVPPDRSSDKVRFDVENEDQFRDRAARPARSGEHEPAPPPARARAARRGPKRPPRRRDRRCHRRGRWPSSSRVSRGIVVEAYEQLAAEGYLVSRPGGATQVAAGARPAPSRPPGPGDSPHRVRLPAGAPRPRPVPAGHLAPLGPAGAQRGAQRAVRLPRRARHARIARARSPTTSIGCAGRRPAPTTSSSARASPRASSWWPRSCAKTAPGGSRIEDPTQSGEPRRPSGARAGGGRDPGRRVRVARRHARRRRCRCRRRDRRAPVPDRRRPPAGAAVGAAGLGRAPRRDDRRGRLRRRVPLRPRTDRRDPGAQPRARRLRRFGQQDPGARPAARLGHRSRRASPTGSGARSGSPTSARPRSTSWPSPISWSAASSIATCDGFGRSIAPAATSCWRRSPDTCRSSARSVPRRDCMSSPGCRRTSRRTRSSTVQGGSASASRGSGRERPGRPRRRVSSSATGRSPRRRSIRASSDWPVSSPTSGRRCRP